MDEFNLIDEPWIPCIDSHGQRVEHGIRDTLLQAHELREICDDSPLVTVAVHRLLLAILYRAYDGPKDFNLWKNLYSGGAINFEKIEEYLKRWDGRFELISNSHPFYQITRLQMNNSVPIARLATECASGNNATLFDHCSDSEKANWVSAQAARWLVACQSFALGFGKCGNADINGKLEALPYFADAIALRGMNVWLQGKTLFDTLMINLVPTGEVSLPPWELSDPHKYRDKFLGKKRKVNASLGVVDLFTWQSRLIRLLPNDGSFSRMYIAQGRSADKSPGDPMKVYRVSKEEGISYISLSSRKAAWRDAHVILTIPAEKSYERRPECFNLVARAHSTGFFPMKTQFVAHVVGLASDVQKAGKFLLWRHERMPVPAALLADDNMINRLGILLENAENVAYELNSRTRRMAKLYLAPDAEYPGARQADKDEVARVANAIDPRSIYWARMEKHFFELLNNLSNDWDSISGEWKPDDQQEATNAWREYIKGEARRALEESIRSLGSTARAIQAVARIQTDFNNDDLSRKPHNLKKENANPREAARNESG
ncbi:MAG: type I-E CRISPR-associated protein Cse1/CasA [Candidatus Krumholzibacteriota bacterium]|nr:type I-E CRISPR-associated protein Cse1/CasA [Candidatus Krumholzibacteriota bacterium]